jgi:hypothetical protein
MKPLLLLVAVLLAALPAAMAQPAAWRIGWQLPPEAQGFDIADDIEAAGIPMRLQGFVSTLPPRQLADRFAQRLGEPLVETPLPGGRGIVLGRMQEDAYLTVHIAPSGSGSRGIVALASAARIASRRADAQSGERWLRRFPAGTRLLSDSSARDGGRSWHQLVLSNAEDTAFNRDALLRAMREDGMQLRHAVQAQAGQALLFAAPGRETIASILPAAGGSAIVLDMTGIEREAR